MTSSQDSPDPGRSPWIRGSLPFVGRSRDMAFLETLLGEGVEAGPLIFVAGEGGVGKSRLVTEFAGRARAHGWSVAVGHAYPVDSAAPYGLFADAFLPLLRDMDPETLTVLSRGGEAELRYLFPGLRSSSEAPVASAGAEPEEFRTRLRWNFSELLRRFAARTPLLVVLEDLQWVDDSSLQLLHFLARQAAGQNLRFLCTYNETTRDRSAGLAETERSLLALGQAARLRLRRLSRDDVADLVCRTFDVDYEIVKGFCARLYEWTKGNAFVLEEILKSLVASDRLSSRKGTWIGWDATEFELPHSIRDAVVAGVATLSPVAQRTADLAAVFSTPVSYGLLAAVGQVRDAELLAALDELCGRRILSESMQGDTVMYEFVHQAVRLTLYRELSLQRTRVLHRAVAEAMEASWGAEAPDHADELAYHFARADAQDLRDKAVMYLAVAGRNALDRHADREAADYLKAALDRCPEEEATQDLHTGLAEGLGRAHLRLGEYDAAARIWAGLLERVEPRTVKAASLHRLLGLVLFWNGDRDGAMDHFTRGLAAARAASAETEVVRIHLARGHCLQELGRGEEALAEILLALPVAERIGDVALLAKAHRSLAQLHVWIGPPEAARRHADEAIELARAAGDPTVEFWARWVLAVLTGLTGNVPEVAEHRREATALAERLRSPVLRLWTAELGIELAYATGDWDGGVTLGERSITLARTLNQRRLLPRLLVWTSLFYVGRGQLERAKALVDEACDMSGMNGADEPVDIHLVVPAHIGLAHYLLGTGHYRESIRVARRGLEIAEGTGYVLWAMHRLLPILAEACLWAGEIDEAEAVGKRMRAHGQALDHKLGKAWADACDALVRWKRGDTEGGAVLMRQAAEALESLPMISYASRIRRQLAGRLAEIGDREGALRELRKVHETFVKLGAVRELEKARHQFREVGRRPPPRGSGSGPGGLTVRETEIAHLVAARKSNKAIGKELGISPRTVSTHLSNIFQKLGVSSRGELADFMHTQKRAGA